MFPHNLLELSFYLQGLNSSLIFFMKQCLYFGFSFLKKSFNLLSTLEEPLLVKAPLLAEAPAILPMIITSSKALPPRRLAPCRPAETFQQRKDFYMKFCTQHQSLFRHNKNVERYRLERASHKAAFLRKPGKHGIYCWR